MNAGMILSKLPFTGLLKELLAIGLLELVESNIFTSEKAEMHERAAELITRLSEKFETDFSDVSSSKIVPDDRIAYFEGKSKRLTKWYGEGRIPQDYIGLMIYVLKGTSNLLKRNKIDFVKSLEKISIGKEILLGEEYNDSLAIVPAVVKQAEFYEYQHEFLKPTAGVKPGIFLDPVWFAILAIGFLRCFAGYYRKSYYFITKEGVEAIADDPVRAHKIHDAIQKLTSIHTKTRPLRYSEELYELRLSYGVASSQIVISSEAFPLKIYEVSLVGNAYTCTASVLIDLTESIKYLETYIDYLRSIPQISFKIKVKDVEYDNPIHALLELAEREIKKPVQGDNSMLLLTFVKDLYRAIHVGRPSLMEETLFRLLRISQSILQTKEKVNLLLKKTLEGFIHDQHVLAVIRGCER